VTLLCVTVTLSAWLVVITYLAGLTVLLAVPIVFRTVALL